MTDDLLLKLRKALAFDEAMHVSECIARNEDDQSGLGMAIKDWCDGARFEARHRRKVDEALVECALALESITNGLLAGISPYNAQVDKAFYALKALEAAVDKLEG